MKVFFVGQPFRDSPDAFEFVADALADQAVRSLDIAVAWLRMSGLGYLAPEIDYFRGRGGRARAFVGIDRKGTTHQGLAQALTIFDDVFIVHDIEGRTFHPKLYIAASRERAHLLVGSQNLTQGGLHFNYEAAISLLLERRIQADRQLWDQVKAYLAELEADPEICVQLNGRRLAVLVREGFLGDENDRRSGSSTDDELSSGRRGRPSLFGRSLVEKRRGVLRPRVRLAQRRGGPRRGRTRSSPATCSTTRPRGSSSIPPRRNERGSPSRWRPARARRWR